MLVSGILFIIHLILNTDRLINDNWRNKRKFLNKYMKAYLVKPQLFPLFKFRLIVFYRLCGRFILNNRRLKKLNDHKIDVDEHVLNSLKKSKFKLNI